MSSPAPTTAPSASGSEEELGGLELRRRRPCATGAATQAQPDLTMRTAPCFPEAACDTRAALAGPGSAPLKIPSIVIQQHARPGSWPSAALNPNTKPRPLLTPLRLYSTSVPANRHHPGMPRCQLKDKRTGTCARAGVIKEVASGQEHPSRDRDTMGRGHQRRQRGKPASLLRARALRAGRRLAGLPAVGRHVLLMKAGLGSLGVSMHRL